jgi:hypothetical protein
VKPAPSWATNSFYVNYISGTTLTPANFISTHDDIAVQNVGNTVWLSWYPPTGERSVSASNGNNYILLSNMYEEHDSKDRWPIGSNFGCACMQNVIYDGAGKKSSFAFDAKITNVKHV